MQQTEIVTKEAAIKQCVQGWLQILGPTTANAFATRLNLDPPHIFQAFLAMEMQGLPMRGAFEHPSNHTKTMPNRMVRTPHPPTHPSPHPRHPPQAGRSRHPRRLHALAARLAAPRPADPAHRRRRRPRSPPPTRRLRSPRHRVGAHPAPRPRRQLRSSLARRPLPLRRRRLGPRLPAPRLVSRRDGCRPAPRHPHQRRAHHLLPPRVRRLAPPRPRATIRRRTTSLVALARSPRKSAPSSSNAAPASPTTSSASPTSPARKPSTPSGSSPPPASPPPTASTNSAP